MNKNILLIWVYGGWIRTPVPRIMGRLFYQLAVSQYVEQKLKLSWSLRCDRVCNKRCFDFGHTVVLLKFVKQKLTLRCSFRCDKVYASFALILVTLLSCLSLTWLFNKLTQSPFAEQKLALSCSFRCDKVYTSIALILVTLWRQILSIMTFSITTFSITTLGIMTFSIIINIMTLSIMTEHCNARCHLC